VKKSRTVSRYVVSRNSNISAAFSVHFASAVCESVHPPRTQIPY